MRSTSKTNHDTLSLSLSLSLANSCTVYRQTRLINNSAQTFRYPSRFYTACQHSANKLHGDTYPFFSLSRNLFPEKWDIPLVVLAKRRWLSQIKFLHVQSFEKFPEKKKKWFPAICENETSLFECLSECVKNRYACPGESILEREPLSRNFDDRLCVI